MRGNRLLVVASIVVFFDVAFFSAITPLLPTYVRELEISKAGAGILSGAYAAGTLVASLPAGLLAARVGPRRTVICGLGLLGLSSVVFGFAEHLLLLDAARFVQGVAGAMSWSGVITWLVLSTSEGKRGAVIGTALGAAVAGELLGPALGALAVEVGTKAIFSSVLLVVAGLIAAALRLPDVAERQKESLRQVWRAMSSRPVVLATGLVALPSILFGVTVVLVPLRIDELGGGSALVAAAFAVGAGLEAMLAPVMGRRSDRIGRQTPIAAGYAICAIGILVVPAPDVLALVIAAVVLICLGAGTCFAPAMTMLSDSAEATGLHQGMAAGLANLAWAAGQVTGGVGGGAAASAAGDWLPCYLIAAILLVAATSLRQLRLSVPGASASESPARSA
jgi:MFS family permease